MSPHRVIKKVVIVGDGACGKTSLSVAFSTNEFPEEHVPTVYDTYTKEIALDGKTIELALWDTAGEEDYDRLRPLSYGNADIMVVCFAINNPTSLQNVKTKWAPELKHFCKNVPFILVGNKLDLRTDPDVVKELKQFNEKPVKYEEGLQMSKKIKARAYMECSARLCMHVREVFSKAAEITLEQKEERRVLANWWCC